MDGAKVNSPKERIFAVGISVGLNEAYAILTVLRWSASKLR